MKSESTNFNIKINSENYSPYYQIIAGKCLHRHKIKTEDTQKWGQISVQVPSCQFTVINEPSEY